MRNKGFNKLYILGTIGLLVIVLYFIFLNTYKNSEPFAMIQALYNIEDHELIATQKTEDGIMVYSVGKVNNGADNMYFADMVRKSIGGYKWIDGAGHISRNLRDNRESIFSTQLLNGNQDINSTIFGVFSDENINQITVRTTGEPVDATIYDGKDEEEKFYVISLEQSLTDVGYFMFTVSYKNGERLDFFIRGKEANEFQEGTWFYFCEEDIEN